MPTEQDDLGARNEAVTIRIVGEIAALSDVVAFLLAEAAHRRGDSTLLDSLLEWLTRHASQAVDGELVEGLMRQRAEAATAALTNRLDRVFIDAKTFLRVIGGVPPKA